MNLPTKAFGVSAALSAGLIWGIYPIFYKPLADIDILEVISHRVLWSVIFLAPLILIFHSSRTMFVSVFHSPRAILSVLICASILSAWWLLYVYCLINDLLLEASLGYFLGPVLTYLLSIFLLKERIVALPAIASATAFFGVFYFIIFSEAGIPFFGILLGLCYSLYTVYKRGFHVIGAKISVFSEFTVMLPFAVAYLLFKFHHDTLTGFISTTATENALLVFIGLINVIPMLLYSFASRETPGVTMSFLQFVSPVCNFFLAVFLYGEDFTRNHLIMFSFVWIGILLYSSTPLLKSSKAN